MARHRAPNSTGSILPPRVRLKPRVVSIRGALTGVVLAGACDAVAGELPVPKANFAPPGQASLDTSVANTLTINQQVARATLNWQSFNIGKGNMVRFAQPSAQAIALNRIAQSDPSKIMGQIKANGQVYLINQNGFVFGKDSQVNVNTLVASTLDIRDDTFQRGLTKVIGQDGRPALVGDGQVYLRDAEGNFVLDANGKKQKISIDFEPGAKVTVDKSGRIIAAAPKVMNQGELSAPDGQILLVAASDKVYLQEAGSDSPFRGLMVEVGSGGEVQNLGRILAERGNVTLMGFAVNQNGRVSATTSVRANGSVRLLAREGATVLRDGDNWALVAKKTTRTADAGDGLGLKAKVKLGQGSLTEASPDLKDADTAVDGQAQDPSYVELMGKNVVLEKGAKLRSLSGRVEMTATETPDQPGQPNVENDSRIYIDQGAIVDVSGIDKVSLPMERNVLSVELRSNELRDAPLQRNGVLYGQKINVDIRKGTPIADIQGALDRIERTVRERSTLGGILDLVSEGDAVIRPGALLNFAGGSVVYRPGYIKTTELVHDRQLVDIGNADPNVKYDGIVQTTGPGKFESGYVDGKSAGKFTLKANALALDGEINGSVKNGAYQREPKLQASAGSLSIDLARTPNSTQAVIFRSSASARSIGEEDPFPKDLATPDRPSALILTEGQLRRSDLLKVDIATAGKVEVESGESLPMPSGGSLSLTGGEVAMNGEILAHSGNVKLATKLTSSTQGVFSGAIELGSQARIDVSGAWVNDLPAGVTSADTGPIWIDGGKATLSAQGDVRLKAGSLVDVSGGGRWQSNGVVVAGNAGDIQLEAALLGGSDVSLGGELQGYALSGGKGGSLSLTSDSILVGAGASSVSSPSGHDPLVVAADLFGRGGFSNYSLTSNQSGLTVSAGTHIDVSVENRVLDVGYTERTSGSDIHQFSHVELLPESIRPAGQLSLALAQKVGQGAEGAAVNIEKGAILSTRAGGVLNLSSDSSVRVDGILDTPAGQISISVTPPAGADPGFLANQGIWLGQDAQLNAKGVALVQSDARGNRTGEVLSGGQVSLHADRGFIIAQPGSLIDVSGTQAVLDITSANASGAKLISPQLIPSDGGMIELRAAEGIQLQGALQGKAGEGSGAAGGTLSLELDPRTRAEPDQLSPSQIPFPRVESLIPLTQSMSGTSPSLAPGQAVAPEYYGQAALTADPVGQGGFGILKLRTVDGIAFDGTVNLHTQQGIVLDARSIAFHPGASGGTASLESAYVGLGSTQSRPGDASSLAGSGVLKVKAGTLDLLGTTALQGFGQADLASSGDLRLIGQRNSQLQRDFLGEFLISGDLSLQASRIYPTTLSDFRIAALGGQLNIKPAQTAETTAALSAGGKLTLEAANITQGGVVEAPLGTLVLKASDSLQLSAGSLTSNSAKDVIIPFGRTQGGLDWIYPLGGQNLVFSAPPGKKLVLEGKNLDLAKDSVVDTSGGGDLYAFEFVPGPGGSADLLNPSDPKFLDGSLKYRQSYAVLPDFKGSTAPYDPLESPDSGLKAGDSIYLSGGGGLRAGNYRLLPAHYALLPGAFLVTPESGTTDLSPGQQLTRADGASIVAGYRNVADTPIHDARWSGFAVESGKAVRQRAEYQDSQASAFYVQRATDQSLPVPTLPRDAGTMRFTVTDGLSLDGKVSAEPAKDGLGGSLDIEAERLAILAQSQAGDPVSGAVNLIAENLSQLGMRSIVLGGVRNEANGVTTLEAKSSTVSLEKDAQLNGAEFILLAKDRISLAEGARIKASQDPGSLQSPSVYRLTGDAAYLNVSSRGLAELDRGGLKNQSGAILVDPGATLSSVGSIDLDASTDARIDGSLDMNGGALALGARRISLGEGGGSAGGLV
ncbi:MAG: filamentous hemagglutinin N-terminal domain-containing protein, partial [Methylococcaceae bacterium]|nr:filamentous hemagglutinin N-terminal domain-containing protein [Methylococcaceae bacterium]